MKKYLFNPFEYVPILKALMIGLIAIILTGILNHYIHKPFHFVLNWGLMKSILNGLGAWFFFSLLLYIIGVIFSTSKVRFVDVLGTQALARVPGILNAGIASIPLFNKFMNFFICKFLQKGCPSEITSFEIVLTLMLYALLLLFLIWMLILMYNAFKVSTNLKGEKCTWLFIVALVLTIITSMGIQMLSIDNKNTFSFQ